MAILPEEIETKEFIVALRGYDKDEVHDFLKAVAEELRALRASRSSGQPEDPIKDLGDHVMEVIRTAHDVARRIQESAKSESDELLRMAREEADGLREEATKIRDTAEREAARLTKAASKAREDSIREATELREAAKQESEEMREAAQREAAKLREKAVNIWGDIERSDDASEGNGSADGGDQRTRAVHQRLAELHAELDQLASACRDLVEILRAGFPDPSPPAARSI